VFKNQKKLAMLSNKSNNKKRRYRKLEKPESGSCQHLKAKSQFVVKEFAFVGALKRDC
jgi:hypothetical protein